MFYGYLVKSGILQVSSFSGYTFQETNLATDAGWVIYATTDRNAWKDACNLANADINTGKLF